MGRQYRHLTLAEREDIMVHWKNRVGVSEIARLVGRDKSTVSREIRRNGWYSPVAGRMWCYRASTAHDKSQRRARRCRRQPLLADPRRLELVARLIRDRHWSPEQIEGRIMIERPDLADNPKYATNVERAKNRLVLSPMLKELIAGFPRELLLERLSAAGIPCGKVAGLHEALTSERTRRGGLLKEMPHPVAGTTHVFAPPYRLDGQRLPIRNAPPTLGAATRDVLQQLLQLPEAELQALRDKGVLTLPLL